jgi:hypothetical protein
VKWEAAEDWGEEKWFMTRDQRRWLYILVGVIVGAVIAFVVRWWLG